MRRFVPERFFLYISRFLLFAGCLFVPLGVVHATETDRLLESLRVGHWVEVRGRSISPDKFVADRIEIRNPRSNIEIWGVAQQAGDGIDLRVHGRVIKVPEKYRDRLHDFYEHRVRVKGKLGRNGQVVAKRIQRKSPGVDRIRGRINQIDRKDNGQHVLEIAGVLVELTTNVREREKIPVQQARIVLPIALASSSADAFDTDDLFGEGFVLTPSLHVGINQDVTLNDRTNYELDSKNDSDVDADDDRRDLTHTLRGQLTWSPNARVVGILDGEHRFRKRDIRNESAPSDSRSRLRSAVVIVRELPGGFDMATGRQDFDDPREWLYDQDLDAIRLFRQSEKFNWEVSVSSLLDDGSARDEDTLNTMLYVSNREGSAHKAAYFINRNRTDGRNERYSYLGLRWLQPKEDQLGGWIDASYLTGNRSGESINAWALDGGLRWSPDFLDSVTLTAGYALASGSSSGKRDKTFRQTGLQDNSGRLGGVSSVRYYGEVFDPELSNMHISTLSVAWRFWGRNSIELIAHSYRQYRANDDLASVDTDRNPNGINRDLGRELDLVFSIRKYDNWEVNLVAGRFEPGDAFGANADSASLAEAQFKVRY